MQNIISEARVTELNNRATALYAPRAAQADEQSERMDIARESLEMAAEEAGLSEIESSSNDMSVTRIYRDADGALANCWFDSPDARYMNAELEGVGFDEQVEWYTHRDEVDEFECQTTI